MQNSILLENKLDIDKKLDFQENRNKTEFTNVIEKVIDSGTSYVIKALPISNNIKDIILDVKNAFKTKDFKEIVKTAVNSSVREGLEILNLPKNIISDITKIGKIAFKGGLSSALSAGIDIVSNKYLKNNIFSPLINKFLQDMKTFVGSTDFKTKIDCGIKKLLDKTDKFGELCDSWYTAYEKFDLFGMNNICRNIKKMQPHIVNDKDCLTQTNIIDNMTKLVNNKNEKLSQMQMQICNAI